MKFCLVQYGDFIVWHQEELVVVQISLDEQFLADVFEKTTNFFLYDVLPELLAKWYSSLPEYSSATHTVESSVASDSLSTWCFCQSEES